MKNPYQTLGVDRTADTETIRKAYKKLARKWHPDINKSKGAEERFKEVNHAYDTIGDPEKRKLFDDFGEASTRPGFDADQARAWQRGGGRAGGFPGGGFGGGVDVEDLLGSLFGQGMGRGPRRGADQQLSIDVPFMDIVHGNEQRVTIGRPDGSTETLKIPVPAGAKDGGRVRLKGQGLPPRGGGPCGDLLVELKITPHPFLKRDGNNLTMEVPITVLEALQGASIEVPTPTGSIRVTVPAKTKSGAKMRIRGKGIQARSGAGDLFLVLRPTLPNEAPDWVIEAATALEQAYATPVRSKLKL